MALADAGDTIEDANFEEEKADAQLLRLYTFVEWVKETLNITETSDQDNATAEIKEQVEESKHSQGLVSSVVNWVKEKLHISAGDHHQEEVFTESQKKNFRVDTNFTYYDRVFDSAINQAIQLTQESYDKMLYKDVLKYGFFELQNARDNYRELCSENDRMNLRLIKRFIEVQALLLAPICPHICDYIYQLIHPGTTIMNAKWPVQGNIEKELIASQNYILETAHDFRLRLTAYKTQQSSGKSKEPKVHPPLSPNHATIFVARSYPSWQTFVLNELKKLYLDNHRQVPDGKTLTQHFKNRPEIDKKYVKKLMPFVIYSRDLLEKTGDIQSLDRHLGFDEYQVLSKNEDYFRRTLNIEQLNIRLTNESETADSVNLEDILPGKPIIHFRHEAMIPIRLINRQAFSGHFEWKVNVMNGDTIEIIENRLRRNADRRLKNAKTIRFYHFQNWEFHSRTIPNIADPLHGLVEFGDKQKSFQTDLRHGTIMFGDQDIGNVLVYFVE